ncbi:MlaA family lipoprotein [Parapedomonas caeni]
MIVPTARALRWSPRPHLVALALALAATPAAAQESPTPAPAPSAATDITVDRYERSNRAMHNFNMGVDRLLLKPIAQGYRAVAPTPMRRGVTNAINNLQEPFTMANALLQGKPGVMMKSLGRFLINSTIGFAGLADRASEWGIPAQEEDFGQTLAVWGVGEGPYLVLPFLGPSNPRDALGFVVEFIGDPASIVITNELGKQAGYAHLGTRVLDARANAVDTIDPLLKSSDDPYVLMRSAYRQKRAFDIADGAVPAVSDEEDIFDDDVPDTTPAAEDSVPQETPAADNGGSPHRPDQDTATGAAADDSLS